MNADRLRAAIYYFNHSRWCRRHGYTHDADIYELDSWNILIEIICT